MKTVKGGFYPVIRVCFPSLPSPRSAPCILAFLLTVIAVRFLNIGHVGQLPAVYGICSEIPLAGGLS